MGHEWCSLDGLLGAACPATPDLRQRAPLAITPEKLLEAAAAAVLVVPALRAANEAPLAFTPEKQIDEAVPAAEPAVRALRAAKEAQRVQSK